MSHKVIYFITAAVIAALLIGDFIVLLRDDVQEIRQYRRIKAYRPDMSVLDINEDSAYREPDKTVVIPKESKEKIVSKVQEFGEKFDNSIGWVYIPGTKIDYPVMYSGDNDYYLNRGVDGSYLKIGSVFLDGRCSSGLDGNINILYGHNMSDGSMFADIVNYADEYYFLEHNTGWLAAGDSVYMIQFFSVSQPECTDVIYDVSIPFESWTKMLKNRSYIWKDIDVGKDDRLIAFSTCTDTDGTSRTLLTGKIISM